MCPSGKRRWARRAGAHREAKRLTRAAHTDELARRRRKRRGLVVPEVAEYYCAACGGWHVLTRNPRPRGVDA